MDSRELLPKTSYKYCVASGIDPLILIDSRIISIYTALKKVFPSIYVNNWHVGGKFDQSGYRNDPNTGSRLSQHRFGRAIDIHGVDHKKLYDYIVKNRTLLFKHVTAIEDLKDTPSWLHIDVRFGDFKIVNGG
jgi:hypothetical protein